MVCGGTRRETRWTDRKKHTGDQDSLDGVKRNPKRDVDAG